LVLWLTKHLGTASCQEGLESDIQKIDVTDLVEGAGNDHDILRTRILESVTALRGGRKVVVCCDRGIVRSNTLAIVILVCSGSTYKEALKLILKEVGAESISMDLLKDATEAVNST